MTKNTGRKLAASACLILVASSAYAQKIIENPRKPLNPEAGRTIALREVLRIRDDGKDIVFKYPGALQIGSDGGIYVFQMPSHLKYDAAGKLVFKIVRDGQGPGEAQFASKLVLCDDSILVQTWRPMKMMRYDLGGKYLGEIRTTYRLYDYIGIVDGKLYGFREDEIPNITAPGFYDVSYTLFVTDRELSSLQPLVVLPFKWYLGAGFGFQRAPFDFAYLDRENIFVLHTDDYGISVLGLDKKAATKIIKRDYPRIKAPPEDMSKRRAGGLYPPPRDYNYDVRDLILFGDKLWAVTSTVNKDGLRLIDVFDKDGRYLDNFYLAYPAGFAPCQYNPGFMTARDGFFYSIDQDEEGYFSIAKYALVDPGKRNGK